MGTTRTQPDPFLQEVGRERLAQAAKDKDYLALYDALFEKFDAYFTKQSWTQKAHPEFDNKPVAYFSMEFGLHETLPIYSGGLGVLAGDHLKESSDLGLPLVAVGFMYAQGYFSQRISEDGWQEAINNPLTFEHLPVSLVTKKQETRHHSSRIPRPQRHRANLGSARGARSALPARFKCRRQQRF